MKKFSLTTNKIEVMGITLFQIKAEMSFGAVSKGELGGWIEKEENILTFKIETEENTYIQL